MANSIQKLVLSFSVYGANQVLWSIEVVELTATKDIEGNKINTI